MVDTSIAVGVTPVESAQEHPLYQAALQNLQLGRWEKGLEQLAQLEHAYPLDHELRALRADMSLRARIDQDEKVDRSRARGQYLKSLILRTTVLILLAGLAYITYRAYSRTLELELNNAEANLAEQVEALERAAKFREAQDFLGAGQPDRALVLFKEVQAEDPAYPEILNYLAITERQIGLHAQYQQAIALMNSGDLPGALVAFKAIKEPYLDVSIRIAEIEKDLHLQDLLAQAEAAYIGGAWEESVALFEQVVAEDPDYQSGLVFERLKELYPKAAEAAIINSANKIEGLEKARNYFDKLRRLTPNDPAARAAESQVYGTVSEVMCWTYVQAAQNALAGQEGSMVAVQLAENYFNQALEFCPDDETITLQRDLADRFLKSQDAFARAQWDTVIAELDLIFREDPDYAQGAARQTLYEAYIARGKAESARGVYEAALADFQQAAVIAEQDPESVQRLFEAQHRVAAAQSDLGNYENAVLLYRSAIDRSGLEARAQEDNPDLASLLNQADGYADARNFRMAASAYREAVERSTETYETVTHVVQLGEYLTYLAAKYQTTVSAIAQVNNIPDPNRVIAGQELLIPILPEE